MRGRDSRERGAASKTRIAENRDVIVSTLCVVVLGCSNNLRDPALYSPARELDSIKVYHVTVAAVSFSTR